MICIWETRFSPSVVVGNVGKKCSGYLALLIAHKRAEDVWEWTACEFRSIGPILMEIWSKKSNTFSGFERGNLRRCCEVTIIYTCEQIKMFKEQKESSSNEKMKPQKKTTKRISVPVPVVVNEEDEMKRQKSLSKKIEFGDIRNSTLHDYIDRQQSIKSFRIIFEKWLCKYWFLLLLIVIFHNLYFSHCKLRRITFKIRRGILSKINKYAIADIKKQTIKIKTIMRPEYFIKIRQNNANKHQFSAYATHRIGISSMHSFTLFLQIKTIKTHSHKTKKQIIHSQDYEF